MHSAPKNAATQPATGTPHPTDPGPRLPPPRQTIPAPTPHQDTGGPHQATAAPAATSAPDAAPDPRPGWSATVLPPAPTLHHRRDGILPNVAAALTVHGTTLTCTAARRDQTPALHPLVQEFLDALTSSRRDRFTGRCAETLLVSRHLATVDATRGKRAQRKPMTHGEARKALKNATLTTRHIREDGDPLHGSFAGPCRACTALAAHFGIRIVAPGTPDTPGTPNAAAT